MLKSSREDLRNRGAADEADIHAYKSLCKEELFEKTNSAIASERTAAIIALRDICGWEDMAYTRLLLDRLSTEKALYTKIEICNSLEKGNAETATVMCDYLGKIGKNQHISIPDAVSKKKSYPLPRDIIARTLGRMDASVWDALYSKLQDIDNINVISELLDAMGYLVFNNPELGNPENFNQIKEVYKKYSAEELIVWRITLCCSMFPIVESKDLLQSITDRVSSNTIIKEADRSLKLIM
ncbi:hypothetical protein [Prevotella sp. 10(H)]|uniref:hypothetical protein n=1 Tax=Prevotella sp. 10(H) TaxID=1158294 RepID=UPI0004A6D1DC|nr:hypothetical protein [Prevotella sp. 10(H)]